MARDGLFPIEQFTDFGSCEFLSAPPPQLMRVIGPRSPALRAQVRLQCPNKPGVYGMLDEVGDLIYVGKARRLRTRLLSYFRPKSRDPKAGRILRHTRAIVWETAPHEFAALLRELELIRRWRPRWNVQGQPLRRRLAFLCLSRAPAPYLYLSARPPQRSLGLFGPLPASHRAKAAVCRLNDIFKLRDCPQPQEMVFRDQGDLFGVEMAPGCLRAEIGSCLAPCAALCSQRDYQKQVRAALAFLEGRDGAVLEDLEKQMRAVALNQEYERAATLRDKWNVLDWLTRYLARLRHAQEERSLVYPLTGWDGVAHWFCIHGARVIAAVPAPFDRATAVAARKAVSAIFDKHSQRLLAPYEHVDGRWLVMNWFRRFPNEIKRTLTPGQALQHCDALK